MLGVLRVGVDVRVVPGALAEAAVGVDQPEALSAVVGAEEAPLLGLDQGPDAARARPRNGHPDSSLDPLREPLGDRLPRVASVAGPVEAGVLAAAFHGPGPSHRLPDRGVENARVGRVDGQVHRARLVADEEHLLPGLAAVLRAEDPALRVRTEGVAQRRDVDEVGVARVNTDSGDLAGLLQADVTPALAGIGRPVDTVSRRDVASDAGRTHAGIDHVGVGLGDRHRPHRSGPEVLVGDVVPGDAGVCRLPHPSTGRAHVVGERVPGDAGHCRRASAPIGADVAVLEGLEELGVQGRLGAVLGLVGRAGRSDEQAGPRQQDECETQLRHGAPPRALPRRVVGGSCPRGSSPASKSIGLRVPLRRARPRARLRPNAPSTTPRRWFGAQIQPRRAPNTTRHAASNASRMPTTNACRLELFKSCTWKATRKNGR